MLVAVVVVVLQTSVSGSERQLTSNHVKFAKLHARVESLLQDSFFIHWGAVTIGKSGLESGNRGREWNVGQNFGGFSRGRSPTQHDGGVGMYGEVS